MKRGEIYMAEIDGKGSEQKGIRPVLILQNDIGNLHSTTTIVTIMTTKVKRGLPTHVVIHKDNGLKYDSVAMMEQIRVIDKCRLKRKITEAKEEEMEKVNEALKISLAM